jgi:hypothetical protein
VIFTARKMSKMRCLGSFGHEDWRKIPITLKTLGGDILSVMA